MREFNEVAAGEFASHQAQIKRDKIEQAKLRALDAMRNGRFTDYESAESDYYALGGRDDLESYVCNIVSGEIESADSMMAEESKIEVDQA